MKAISDVASQAQRSLQQAAPARSTRSHRSEPQQLDATLTNQLFVRMQSIYGHLWSSRFANAQMLAAAKAEWATALYGCHVNDINRAIEACKREYDKPPTLPEFLKLCRPEAMAPYHRPGPPALPAPRNREVGLAALAELKKRYPLRKPEQAGDQDG